jgi:hypothetical protein
MTSKHAPLERLDALGKILTLLATACGGGRHLTHATLHELEFGAALSIAALALRVGLAAPLRFADMESNFTREPHIVVGNRTRRRIQTQQPVALKFFAQLEKKLNNINHNSP